jgi:hypothetical protein
MNIAKTIIAREGAHERRGANYTRVLTGVKTAADDQTLRPRKVAAKVALRPPCRPTCPALASIGSPP